MCYAPTPPAQRRYRQVRDEARKIKEGLAAKSHNILEQFTAQGEQVLARGLHRQSPAASFAAAPLQCTTMSQRLC